jgi:hypothetical protein
MKINVDSDVDITITLPKLPSKSEITITQLGKGKVTIEPSPYVTFPVEDANSDNEKWRRIATELYHTVNSIIALSKPQTSKAIEYYYDYVQLTGEKIRALIRYTQTGIEFKTIDFDKNLTL